jgi:hypothetical protein
VIVYKVAFSDAAKMSRQLDRSRDILRSYASVAVNAAGRKLTHTLVRDLKAETDIPLYVIRQGFRVRSATRDRLVFSIWENKKVTYVIWRTEHDEDVCRICGPRDGVTYRLEEIQGHFPAHEHCRCGLEDIDVMGLMAGVANRRMPKVLDELRDALMRRLTIG